VRHQRCVNAGRTQRRGEVSEEAIPFDRFVLDTDADFDATDSLDRTLLILGQLKPAAAEVVLLRVAHNLRAAEVAQIT